MSIFQSIPTTKSTSHGSTLSSSHGSTGSGTVSFCFFVSFYFSFVKLQPIYLSFFLIIQYNCLDRHILHQHQHLTQTSGKPDQLSLKDTQYQWAHMCFVEQESKLLNQGPSRSPHVVHLCFIVGTTVMVTYEISIDDLLGNVNRHDYYRYSGSLTTPLCNQAVVWTVFKESVNVDLNLVSFTHHPF